MKIGVKLMQNGLCWDGRPAGPLGHQDLDDCRKCLEEGFQMYCRVAASERCMQLTEDRRERRRERERERERRERERERERERKSRKQRKVKAANRHKEQETGPERNRQALTRRGGRVEIDNGITQKMHKVPPGLGNRGAAQMRHNRVKHRPLECRAKGQDKREKDGERESERESERK
jgi:hypothetical protein